MPVELSPASLHASKTCRGKVAPQPLICASAEKAARPNSPTLAAAPEPTRNPRLSM